MSKKPDKVEGKADKAEPAKREQKNIIWPGSEPTIIYSPDGEAVATLPAPAPPSRVTGIDFPGGGLELPSAEVQKRGWYSDHAGLLLRVVPGYKPFQDEQGKPAVTPASEKE